MCVFKDCSGMVWRLGWRRGAGQGLRGGWSFIHSISFIQCFIHSPSPSLQRTLSSCNGLGERFRKDPGQWESAGLRALGEN